jgi:SAM-dependent methyltransferase
MPANFTRRRDLFLDSGFGDPDAVLAGLGRDVAALGLPAEWGTDMPAGGLGALRAALAPRLARLPEAQLRLARHVPEFVTARSGDLATALWLARAEHGDSLDVPGFLLAILDALAAAGRERDALAYARFMLDLRFDWARVYRDPGLAYAFTRPRDPNPLVWRLLEELAARGARLRVLELGCGVGNDAFGFLQSPIVEAYTGLDVSADALREFEERWERERPPVRPALARGDFVELLASSEPPAPDVNLVYSYSSLHYFSSGELARIYALVRKLLLDGASGRAQGQPDEAAPARQRAPGDERGSAAGADLERAGVSGARPHHAPQQEDSFFAFGIKGAGSVWEGQGLPLYRPDVWVNWDGQSRWFPSRDALDRQLDRAGFEVRFHELHAHWGYSEKGRKDVFHYVLCSPRAARR